MHEMAHFLLRAHVAEHAKVLVVGAGTGKESISYALANPSWTIMGIDPTEHMLSIAAQRAAHHQLTGRVNLHLGTLQTLKSSRPFDAATSILVMQFLPDDGAKENFLREIAARLKPKAQSPKPKASLVLVDLEGTRASPEFNEFIAVWKAQQLATRADRTDVEKDFEHIVGDIQFVPQSRIEELLHLAGFGHVRKFYSAFLFGGYVAERQ
jgi:tRNA (cmo5U34)-methyltransferase